MDRNWIFAWRTRYVRANVLCYAWNSYHAYLNTLNDIKTAFIFRYVRALVIFPLLLSRSMSESKRHRFRSSSDDDRPQRRRRSHDFWRLVALPHRRCSQHGRDGMRSNGGQHDGPVEQRVGALRRGCPHDWEARELQHSVADTMDLLARQVRKREREIVIETEREIERERERESNLSIRNISHKMYLDKYVPTIISTVLDQILRRKFSALPNEPYRSILYGETSNLESRLAPTIGK